MVSIVGADVIVGIEVGGTETDGICTGDMDGWLNTDASKLGCSVGTAYGSSWYENV